MNYTKTFRKAKNRGALVPNLNSYAVEPEVRLGCRVLYWLDKCANGARAEALVTRYELSMSETLRVLEALVSVGMVYAQDGRYYTFLG
jgi:hypothetical protein